MNEELSHDSGMEATIMVIGKHRPTIACVNQKAIAHNISEEIKQLEGRAELFAVVKADGYGHGAVTVSKIAKACGATGFCVAILDEALELREAGFKEPIIILEPISPTYVRLLTEFNLSVTAPTYEWLQEIETMYNQENCQNPIKVHLKIDSGMGRIGFREEKELIKARDLVAASKVFELEGVFTHFATADGSDETYFFKQQQRFLQALAILPQDIRYVHTANTATALWHEAWQSNMIRFGVSIYGLNPSGTLLETPYQLEPALSLETELIQVKKVQAKERIGYGGEYQTQTEEWIGTVPIGYADGIRRDLSGFYMLVDGEKAPIVGRVCMDQCMLKLPKEYPTGTKITVIGKNKHQEITVQDIADYVGTINYEIVCNITERVPRVLQ